MIFASITKRKWYAESLYLLAMLDYVSRVNNVPLCTRYADLRRCKLSETVFPASVLATAAVSKNERVKDQSRHEAIRNSCGSTSWKARCGMSSESTNYFTKDNLDTYLKELAKTFRKLNRNSDTRRDYPDWRRSYSCQLRLS